ncbi:MAG TPA: universal stress protein [Gemmatimonadales bacterium]|nr:universal stress protein [Gemmatimonadales bacterium]
MVAVDISHAAKTTVERATAFAQVLGGPLHALHVVEPAVTVPEILLRPDPLDFEGWSREHMDRDISAMPLGCVALAGVDTEQRVERANPEESGAQDNQRHEADTERH